MTCLENTASDQRFNKNSTLHKWGKVILHVYNLIHLLFRLLKIVRNQFSTMWLQPLENLMLIRRFNPWSALRFTISILTLWDIKRSRKSMCGQVWKIRKLKKFTMLLFLTKLICPTKRKKHSKRLLKHKHKIKSGSLTRCEM